MMIPALSITAFALATLLALATEAEAGAQGALAVPADPWPRQIDLGRATALLYQPQIESWQGNKLDLRAAVAVKPAGSKQDTFGVVWATARTQVDRASRIVALEDFTFTRSNFPTVPDGGSAYMRAMQEHFAASQRTIALDRLEASLAASKVAAPSGLPVNNDPPRIIVSEKPAILVPIDGAPVVRQIPGLVFERVINTRALIVRPQGSQPYYLHVYDGWLFAGAVTGPWIQALVIPPAIDAIAQQLAASGKVDLLHGRHATPKPSLQAGVPAIYVSETPAELLVFNGPPALTPIAGTALQWASNTNADVIYDTTSREYYVLLSGRWYRAAGLTGSWTFAPSPSLPADFRKIPPRAPAGVVLASVAGTPQAREAVIANSIPQTAAVPRANGPAFTPAFDGAPELGPVAGTELQYVVNSPTPVIRVNADEYYALRAGVWFRAAALAGPWYVAAYVPAVVYTIPPTSPLHYVTYVQVYGSTAKVVYVGYTPGYLGTVVAPGGVVVYGTGYAYQPWVGTAWYPPPATYGAMVQPVYNPAVGMAFGFAMGVTTAAISGAYYHPSYVPGYGDPCCASTSANVYGHYGNTSWSGTRSYYSDQAGNVGQEASGSYTNYRTGTTGSYSASRSVNQSAGTAQRSYTRSFTTPDGTTGNVARNETYNANTGRYSYASNVSATGPGGTQVTSSRQTGPDGSGGTSTERQTTATNPNTGVSRSTTSQAGVGPQGAGAERTSTYTNTNTGATATTQRAAGTGTQGSGRGVQTTYTNPTTGQTKTYGAAKEGNNVYADNDGNVYHNSGSGWQQHTSSGWQSTGTTPSWASSEQQARSQGDERFSSYQSSGAWAGRSSGGGWGGGGGWGDRFGEAGGGFRGRRW